MENFNLKEFTKDFNTNELKSILKKYTTKQVKKSENLQLKNLGERKVHKIMKTNNLKKSFYNKIFFNGRKLKIDRSKIFFS